MFHASEELKEIKRSEKKKKKQAAGQIVLGIVVFLGKFHLFNIYIYIYIYIYI